MAQDFDLKLPNGSVYTVRWTKSTPPTPDDVDKLTADAMDAERAKGKSQPSVRNFTPTQGTPTARQQPPTSPPVDVMGAVNKMLGGMFGGASAPSNGSVSIGPKGRMDIINKVLGAKPNVQPDDDINLNDPYQAHEVNDPNSQTNKIWAQTPRWVKGKPFSKPPPSYGQILHAVIQQQALAQGNPAYAGSDEQVEAQVNQGVPATQRVPTSWENVGSVIGAKTDPGRTLTKMLGAVIQRTGDPASILNASSKDADIQRTLGTALPGAAVATAMANPVSLMNVATETLFWNSFGGVPTDPEGIAAIGILHGVTHGLNKYSKQVVDTAIRSGKYSEGAYFADLMLDHGDGKPLSIKQGVSIASNLAAFARDLHGEGLLPAEITRAVSNVKNDVVKWTAHTGGDPSKFFARFRDPLFARETKFADTLRPSTEPPVVAPPSEKPAPPVVAEATPTKPQVAETPKPTIPTDPVSVSPYQDGWIVQVHGEPGQRYFSVEQDAHAYADKLRQTPVEGANDIPSKAPPIEKDTHVPRVPNPADFAGEQGAADAALAQIAKEKPSSKTGLTPTQTGWLSQHLAAAYDQLPTTVETQMSPDRIPQGFTHVGGGLPSEGIPIAIPGDGEFTIHSQEQAANLHQAVTGKPIAQQMPSEVPPPNLKKTWGGASENFVHGQIIRTPEYKGRDYASNTHILLLDEPKLIDDLKANSDHPGVRESSVGSADSIIEDAERRSNREVLKPAFTDVSKRNVYYKDASGNTYRINRPYADMIHKRGYDILGGGERKALVIADKEGRTRGVVMPIEDTKLPEGGTLPYKAPKTSIEVPHPEDEGSQAFQTGEGRKPGSGGTKTPIQEARDAARYTPPAPPQGLIPRMWHDLKKAFAPQSMSQRADAANVGWRANRGELQHRLAMITHAFSEAEKFFDKNVREDASFKFVDDMEKGLPQSQPGLQPIADMARKALDDGRERVRALGTGKLENYIENYVPHLYADPEKADGVFKRLFSKKPLEGNKNFLKQRTYTFMEDGLAAGLKPLNDNPIEWIQTRLGDMARYEYAQKFLADTKAKSNAEFFKVGAEIPQGWDRYNDGLFDVHGPNTVTIHESYDKSMLEGLQKLADELGIAHSRPVKIEGETQRTLGISTKKGVQARFATDPQILSHEIWHQISDRYNLRKLLFSGADRETNLAEGRELSKQRYVGQEVSQNHIRYTQTQNEIIANLGAALTSAPHLIEQYAPHLGAALDKFIDSKPELKGFKELRHGLTLESNSAEVKAPGIQTLGHWYGPNDVTAIVNQYLSPGLRGKAWFDGPQSINNSLNRVSFLLSLRHAITTTLNASFSDLSLALKRATSLDPKALLDAAQSPIAVGRDFINGARIRKAYLEGIDDPKMRQFVQGVIEGGGGVGQEGRQAADAQAAFGKAMRRSEYGKALAKGVPAAMEASSSWLMQGLIPRVKLGVFSRMLQFELEKNPKLSGDAFKRTVQTIWDSVDNRMGEVNYRNLNWDPVVKDTLHMAFRAVGWNALTPRENIGGLVDFLKGKGLTHRGAFTISMVMGHALVGAVMTRVLTGHWPTTANDYFFPPTGKLNADGTPQRVALPTYATEWDNLYHKRWATVVAKMAPLPSMLGQMLGNEDYFGNKIVDESDNVGERILKTGEYALKTSLPFSVQQYKTSAEEGAPNDLAWLGINKAPAYVDQSQAMQTAVQYAHDARPMGGRSMESTDRIGQRLNVLEAYRNGDRQRALQIMRDNNITPKEMQSMLKSIDLPPLVAILQRNIREWDAKQYLNIYEQADDKERAQIRGIVQSVVARTVKAGKMSLQERNEMIRRWQQLSKS